MSPAAAPPLRLSGVRTEIGGQVIHDGVDLEMRPGEILGLVGASGAGKSVLLRSIIGLLPPVEGRIELFGHDLYAADEATLAEIKSRWGVLFQANALFSTLSVLENVAVPLREHTRLPEAMLLEIAALKARMSGLPADALHKLPSQLSGGLQKRVGVARAIALDPELILLDEPTAGLDPLMAEQIDALVASLARTLGLSVLVVTHDLDTLYTICDRVAVLAERRIIAVAPVRELERTDHPWLHEYLMGKRTRAGQPLPETGGRKT
jgi:phospholipid/cholesterol/gamma-HCH transport system ATP-binding protein